MLFFLQTVPGRIGHCKCRIIRRVSPFLPFTRLDVAIDTMVSLRNVSKSDKIWQKGSVAETLSRTKRSAIDDGLNFRDLFQFERTIFELRLGTRDLKCVRTNVTMLPLMIE